MSVPCARWCIAGIFFRNYAASSYIQYGAKLFYFYGAEYKGLISNFQTFATFVGGVLSNLIIGGYLCDKLEQKYLRTKSLVSGTSLLGSAICYFCMFYPFINIWFPLGFIAVNAFFFEGYTAPTVCQMVNTSSVGKSPIIGLMMVAVGSA